MDGLAAAQNIGRVELMSNFRPGGGLSRKASTAARGNTFWFTMTAKTLIVVKECPRCQRRTRSPEPHRQLAVCCLS
jgi:hypothetical protein